MMNRRFALAALALLLVLPSAAADHVYSHRLVLYGRLVDSQSHPLGGVAISARAVDYSAASGGHVQPHTETGAFGRRTTRAVTDAGGFFMFCQHVHTVSREVGAHVVISAQSLNVSQPVAFDPELRVAFA